MAATPSYHYRLGETRKEALAAMAADRGTDETAQVKAAIDAALAAWRAGQLPPSAAPLSPSAVHPAAALAPYVAGPTPEVMEQLAAGTSAQLQANLERDARRVVKCPHPPARVIKGFCGACGHPV